MRDPQPPLSPADRSLVDAALRARNHAYAPYSRFLVGAALGLADGTVVAGCNVENASYGLTVCAERHAIATAVGAGQLRGRQVERLAVAADAEQCTAPCGACRQVIHEFAAPTLQIILYNVRDGRHRLVQASELLPLAFDFTAPAAP
jgi:homotetrameric cytidine deaminase